MADIDFDAVGGSGDLSSGTAIKTVLNWAGGVMSLALVAGLVNWGYQIMVRDVSGVPVVRALDGPIRVAPDDPGGQEAEHQGLAVNRVAAEGQAAPPADTLRLAPRPVALAAEDLPRADLRPAREAELRALPEDGAAETDPGPDVALLSPAEEMPEGEDLALADPNEQDPAVADEIADAATAAVPAGGLGRSLRPAPRPDEDLAARAAIAAATAALRPAQTGELPAAEVIAGTTLVQLGAFDTDDEARAIWDGLVSQSRFAGFFESKSRVVQETESGGRIFYRLRAAGFDNLADARRFCAALMAEGADCIPVVAR